uniref:Uncharacterized protein n=1 Tax=Janibacter limosus TaxID=53458 RepID=A0AC61U379_9MICO|nr:hypothetical protein [Janibacter limosus]
MTTPLPPRADACTGADGRPPLVNLLARAEASFIADFEARLRASEIDGLSPAHSTNVLRHLSEGPRRARHRRPLRRDQAGREPADRAPGRNSFVAVGRDEGDQRARIVSLTAKGECARVVVRRLFEQVEHDWAERIGAEPVAALRQALSELLGEGTAC